MRYLPRHVKVADVLSKRYLDAGDGAVNVLVQFYPRLQVHSKLLHLRRSCVGGRKTPVLGSEIRLL